MKVAIINRSDLRGGAAIFTYRLMNALCNEGIEASMLVCDSMSAHHRVVNYAHPIADRYHFLAERLQIFARNGFSRENLFKVDTADWGRDLSCHPIVRDADVVMLNWINQGALSLSSINKICRTGKPVVWTMHDMWNCTGICHHAYDCEHYKQQCGSCPYLASHNSHDLSYRSWRKKKALYAMPNLHFVAVSNWLAEKCHASSLLCDKPIAVIPNSVPIDSFDGHRLPNSDYNIPADSVVIAMGAARIDDPVKGFDLLIDVTRKMREQYGSRADNFHLLLFGAVRNSNLLNDIAIPHTHLGSIPLDKVIDVLAHSDILLSTSLYESFGGTLIEGQAAGCIPVSFGNGGQTDIITHFRNGYIAQYKSCDDIVQGIRWATESRIPRMTLHDEVVARFSPHTIAQQYITLLNELTSR